MDTVAAMENAFENAWKAGEIPGVVLLAGDRSSDFRYYRAVGTKNPEGEGIGKDDVMWIASCTKLMTSIAVMQCVERGLLDLDADVTGLLPELKDRQVLVGWEQEEPVLEKRKGVITLRHLLTHTSGVGYDVFDPQLQRYRAHKGEKPGVGTTVTRQFDTPLLFHPGTQWAYGGGHDFAGLMVERATRLRLQDYMARHVWSPLGIRDMTFRPHERGDLRPRMPKMSVRDTESGKAVWMDDGKGIWGFGNAEDDFGGSECCASPQEYFFILKALLRGGGELLKTESVEELFRPALSEDSRRSLEERFSVKEINLALGGLPMGTRKDYSIAGLLNMEDLAGMRSKGTLAWGGMPNLSWWIDRETGLCGLYAGQILPQGDPKSVEMREAFEKAIYEGIRKQNAKI